MIHLIVQTLNAIRAVVIMLGFTADHNKFKSAPIDTLIKETKFYNHKSLISVLTRL